MTSKRKQEYELNLIKLQNRINQLEEIICPCNHHEYIEIDSNSVPEFCGGYVDCYTVRTLQCKKCKKIVRDDDRIGFKYEVIN